MSRTDEEDLIRQHMAPWLEAARRGEIAQVLRLMPDHVIILLPGERAMRKPEFVQRMVSPTGDAVIRIDGFGGILELKVIGEWTFVWTRMHVLMGNGSGTSTQRTGHTLTIFHKEGDQWVPAPDAHLPGPYQND